MIQNCTEEKWWSSFYVYQHFGSWKISASMSLFIFKMHSMLGHFFNQCHAGTYCTWELVTKIGSLGVWVCFSFNLNQFILKNDLTQ